MRACHLKLMQQRLADSELYHARYDSWGSCTVNMHNSLSVTTVAHEKVMQLFRRMERILQKCQTTSAERTVNTVHNLMKVLCTDTPSQAPGLPSNQRSIHDTIHSLSPWKKKPCDEHQMYDCGTCMNTYHPQLDMLEACRIAQFRRVHRFIESRDA